MRPIDADALMEKMKHRWERFGRESDCICLIEDAQTIDAVPVVHGYWRPHPLGYTSNLVKYEEWDVCSNCGIGTKRRNMTDDFFEEYSYSYCPWCGAKMKGEEK